MYPYNNNAYAHPVVIDSNPKQFQSIESPPDRVTVYFSEPIVLQYSQIFVVDAEGKEIEGGGQAEHINDDPTTISMPLKDDMNEGSFTVTTRVLSAVDGHVVDNSIVFSVRKDSTSSTTDFINMETKDKKGIFDILSIENSLSRIAGYIGQIILVGAPFIYLWIKKPFLNIIWIKNILQNHFNRIQKNLFKLLIFSDFLVNSP
ncbi:MAG: copper resistance CopC family protein [Nitrososphaeraceae archaeon]